MKKRKLVLILTVLAILCLIIASFLYHSNIKTFVSAPKITKVTYETANETQKAFLDKVFAKQNAYKNPTFQKNNTVLFYLDSKTALIGYNNEDANNSAVFRDNNFNIALIDPNNEEEFGRIPSRYVNCHKASTFASSCSYMTDEYLIFINETLVYSYKAGQPLIETTLLPYIKESKLNGIEGETYVKEYNKEGESYVPKFESSFNDNILTVTIFKNNQALGMGEFDLTKKNEKLRTVTFVVK